MAKGFSKILPAKLSQAQRFQLKVNRQANKRLKLENKGKEKLSQTVGRTIQNVSAQAMTAAADANRQIQDTERKRIEKNAALNQMLIQYNNAIKGAPEQEGSKQTGNTGDTAGSTNNYGYGG